MSQRKIRDIVQSIRARGLDPYKGVGVAIRRDLKLLYNRIRHGR